MSKKYDVSKDCRLALGDLVVVFNGVESCVRDFIGFLLRINCNQTEIITYKDHLPVLLNRLYALYEIEVCDDKRQKKLSKIVEGLQGCNSKRCEYIHGEWSLGFANNGKPIFYKSEINKNFKANPPDTISIKYVQPLEIHKLIAKLSEYEQGLWKIKRELKGLRLMNPPPKYLCRWQSEDVLNEQRHAL
jgi:hypothetical protein